ncbi:MAG: nuclear transport factor 2 family protein [Panacagrimonas sp.]
MSSAAPLTKASIEAHIRAYFEACNSGNPERIAAYFEPDAIHYFPPGMYGGPFRGALEIGRRWQAAVQNLGSYWTVDQVICEPETRRAAIEWTHFKRAENKILRGDEWYVFSAAGLIAEIRAYYASPQDRGLDVLALGSFDYESRGYPMRGPELKS